MQNLSGHAPYFLFGVSHQNNYNFILNKCNTIITVKNYWIFRFPLYYHRLWIPPTWWRSWNGPDSLLFHRNTTKSLLCLSVTVWDGSYMEKETFVLHFEPLETLILLFSFTVFNLYLCISAFWASVSEKWNYYGEIMTKKTLHSWCHIKNFFIWDILQSLSIDDPHVRESGQSWEGSSALLTVLCHADSLVKFEVLIILRLW